MAIPCPGTGAANTSHAVAPAGANMARALRSPSWCARSGPCAARMPGAPTYPAWAPSSYPDSARSTRTNGRADTYFRFRCRSTSALHRPVLSRSLRTAAIERSAWSTRRSDGRHPGAERFPPAPRASAPGRILAYQHDGLSRGGAGRELRNLLLAAIALVTDLDAAVSRLVPVCGPWTYSPNSSVNLAPFKAVATRSHRDPACRPRVRRLLLAHEGVSARSNFRDLKRGGLFQAPTPETR